MSCLQKHLHVSNENLHENSSVTSFTKIRYLTNLVIKKKFSAQLLGQFLGGKFTL